MPSFDLYRNPGPRGSSKHRPGFHALVLTVGFIAGGLTHEVVRLAMPGGAIKEFLVAGVTPSLGPVAIDLILIKTTVGPLTIDVSLLNLVGVLVAYLIARSLF
ncbi:MAG TPA: DUF4321 domain-containing protein [Gemmatimonadaceae bacterium]|jgi:hypothetical protein